MVYYRTCLLSAWRVTLIHFRVLLTFLTHSVSSLIFYNKLNHANYQFVCYIEFPRICVCSFCLEIIYHLPLFLCLFASDSFISLCFSAFPILSDISEWSCA